VWPLIRNLHTKALRGTKATKEYRNLGAKAVSVWCKLKVCEIFKKRNFALRRKGAKEFKFELFSWLKDILNVSHICMNLYPSVVKILLFIFHILNAFITRF